MKHNKKQIIDSLTIIQNECESCDDCEQCPLFSIREGGCMFNTGLSPLDWMIKKDTEETWSAFQ